MKNMSKKIINKIDGVRVMERETKKGIGTYYCATDLLKLCGKGKSTAIAEFFKSLRIKRDIMEFESQYNLDFREFEETFKVVGSNYFKDWSLSIRGKLIEAGAASVFSIKGGKSPNRGTYMHEIVYAWFQEWLSSKFNLAFHEKSIEALKEKADRDALDIGSEKWKVERKEAASGAKLLSSTVKYRCEQIDKREAKRYDYMNAFKRQNKVAFGSNAINTFNATKDKSGAESIRDVASSDELKVLNAIQGYHTCIMADDSIESKQIASELQKQADNIKKALSYVEQKSIEKANEKRSALLGVSEVEKQAELF